MHDAKSRELKEGDVVLIPAKITQLSPGEEYCNVSAQSLYGRRPDGALESFSAINTGVMLRANPGDENDVLAALAISDAAREAVRLKFNPSGLPNVDRLKTLAAAFITECDRIAAEVPDSGRSLAVAKTNMQTASMWAVLGATTAV